MHSTSSKRIDIISEAEAGTLPGLFFARVRRSPDVVAYCEYRDGRWIDYSWKAMAKLVSRFRAALAQSQLSPGDRVAILLPNCTDWVAFDIAAMASGLITVPLYSHDSPQNNAYVLANSGARLCLIDTLSRCASIEKCLTKDSAPVPAFWVRERIDRSGGANPSDRLPSELQEVLPKEAETFTPLCCAPRDVATIIYTSGTTGPPKGVMLTHSGILWNTEAVTKCVPPLTSDVFLSFLPLAHSFERTMGYYLAMMGGARVIYARSSETLGEDLVTIRPTILIAVPRLYERICQAMARKAEANALKRWILRVAADIGWRLHEWRRGRCPDPGFLVRRLIWPILEFNLTRRVLDVFGGRLRVAVSGGAPLPVKVSHFLVGLGVPLLEGYGLTEASPVVTAPTIEDNWPGSVGRPLPGLEFRLSEQSELVIRSPANMQGYWRDPEATARALSPDGWLRTGDIAQIREGYVFITGRLKDVLVLSTGENIVPTSVEAAIARDALFDQVCVIGDGRPCVAAIVVLNNERWLRFAQDLGIDPSNPNTPIATEAALARLGLQMRGLPSSWQVRAIHLTTQPWTIKDGSLTPTLKIKRRVIEERFHSEISALYGSLAEKRRSTLKHDRG